MQLQTAKTQWLKLLHENNYSDREASHIIRELLRHVLGNRVGQYRSADTEISEEHFAKINILINEVINRHPLAYVVNELFFYNYPFYVNEHVLIPRPETEELVDWVVKNNPNFKKKILDIGTGSGAIAISLAKEFPEATIFAIEVDANAIKVAKKNNLDLQTNVQFIQMNVLTENIPDSLKFDIIVSNPPYIPPSEKKSMDKSVLDYEPELALFVPEDNPLIFYKEIINIGKKHLRKNGQLYLEVNEFQANKVLTLLESNKYVDIILKKDLQGKNRMISAKYLQQ